MDGSPVEIHLDGQFQQVGSATNDDSGSESRTAPRTTTSERGAPARAGPALPPPGSHLSLISGSDNRAVRVLVVEDDVKMAGLLRRGLGEEGLSADIARTGDDALWMAAATEYDAIVLDVMLPGLDGFAVCRRLREAGTWTPVLLLTARNSVDDRVAGLDAGADDYLTKPFSFAELLARLRALVRRAPVERPTVLEVGDLRADPATRQVWRGEAEIGLSSKEFALLETFMRRPGQVLLALPAPRALLGLRVREPLERRGRLRPLPAREDRPAIRPQLDRDRARRGLPDEAGRRGGLMSRIPIRIRLTLAFALAMAVVLAAIGGFLYVRLGSSLDEALDESLQARLVEVSAQLESGDEVVADRRARGARRPDPRRRRHRRRRRSRRPTGRCWTRRDRTRAGRAYLARPSARRRARRSHPGSRGTRRHRARSEDRARRLVARGSRRCRAGAADAAPRRGAGRPASRVAARVRASRLSRCARSSPCAERRRRSRRPSRGGGSPCPQRATRSPAWVRR